MYDDDSEIFRGVYPVESSPPPKRQRAPPAASHAFFYTPREQNDVPSTFVHVEMAEADPTAEAALMSALGLPTSLRPQTAEANQDAYHVWSTDLTARLDPVLSISAEEEPAGELEMECQDAATQPGTVPAIGSSTLAGVASGTSHSVPPPPLMAGCRSRSSSAITNKPVLPVPVVRAMSEEVLSPGPGG